MEYFFGDVLGEFVVEGGNFLFFDLGDFDFERDGLADEFGILIAFRERLGKAFFLSGGQSFDFVVEFVEVVARTDFEREILARRTLDGLSIGTQLLPVEGDDITFARRSLLFHYERVALPDFLEFAVDVGLGYLHLGNGDAQALERGSDDRREHVIGDGKAEVLVDREFRLPVERG